MKAITKTIIFLPDGMADEPLAELGGKTPLQAAATPGMDRIAREGRSGTLLTLPKGFPTSSDVANMSVLGCDLEKEFCGRGVLEAASQKIPLGPDDVAFRCNLISMDPDGTLADFAGGHISQEDAEALIAELNDALADQHVRFHAGVSYRNLMILSGGGYSEKVHCEKPDDHPGGLMADWLPTADEPSAEPTARLLRDLMERAAAVLSASPINQQAVAERRKPANGVWFWSPGRAGNMRTLYQRHGISSAVISAVDVVKGLGHCLGMEVIEVPGATGYIDTNYDGKARAAIRAIVDHDFVYIHVEAIDEVSHARDLALKIKAIEDFDSRIVVPVMKACGSRRVRYAVLPDHPVPVSLGKHTRTPVPLAICGPGIEPDNVEEYNEFSAPCGALGALFGPELMEYLFGDPEPGVGG